MEYHKPTFWFKSCPKDKGDLHLDRDKFGPHIACLQCGYYLSDPQMKTLLKRSSFVPMEDSFPYSLSSAPLKN